MSDKELTIMTFCESCKEEKELHDIFSVDENMYRGICDSLHLVEFYHDFQPTKSIPELPISIITGS